ncbi:MAG: hypothetical protein AB7U82_31040 [Blastocatellales bacterium]
MKLTRTWIITSIFCAALLALSLVLVNRGSVSAQEPAAAFAGALSCNNGVASGTYGYRMSGQIIGVGPVLVNGLFTHNPDGTMSGNVHMTIAGQQIPNASWSDGKFQTNSDCTGSGEFFVAALNQKITYNFIATDGGKQIDLLNTNAGNAFHGVGRRISRRGGLPPRCSDGTILGSYGYRLEGSLPGVPIFVGAGMFTLALDERLNGVTTGADTNGFNGQFVPRTYQGTYKVNSDCTGTGRYTDSLGNTVNYTFVAVDGGEEIYFQGTNPGEIVSGVGRRVQ